MGTLPKTRLLLTNNDMVVGTFDNYSSIAYRLGVYMNDDGHVIFRGEKQNPSYCLAPDLNGWNKQDAIMDWAKYYMIKNLPSSYHIYRFLI